MIEGVVGCLKQRGHGCFRASKKVLRTRRCLHSAFWSHGAGNIDLPAWWLFILQARESTNAVTSVQEKQSSAKNMAAGLHEMFMSFLYPMQTHALIRRLDRATRFHRQAAKLAQQSSRQYASFAEDLLAGKRGSAQREQGEERETSEDCEAEKKAQAMQSKADELLERLALPEDYDRLWMFQQEAFEASESLEASILERSFFSLSDSKRIIDCERSLALFETIERKTSRLYAKAVTTALRLENFEIAVDIHAEAAARNPGSIDIGTRDLMTHAIRRNNWTLAINTWYRFWQSQLLYLSLKDELWQQFNAWTIDRQMISLRRAVTLASSMLDSVGSVDGDGIPQQTAIAARDFALAMADMTLRARGTIMSVPDQYLSLLQEIKTLNGVGGKFYLQAIDQLLSSKDERNHEVTFSIYTELRQEPSFAPSRSLLEQIFALCHNLKSASGQLMVLEDWQKFLSGKPPPQYYTAVGRELSRKRSAYGMETLLKSFFIQYDPHRVARGQKTRFLNTALSFYGRHGDHRTAVQKFDEFQSQYGFHPDTASYNHVIMAYAQVGDLKNTMTWFENLKNSGLVLNHHSFHGPIDVFAKRGDFDAIYDLLADLEKYNLKPDDTIIHAVLVVNLMNNRHEEAERVVTKALSLDLKHPPTRLWNTLLNFHAWRGDLAAVSALHQQMHSAGVPEDHYTYAAVMKGLCQAASADEAWLVMKNVMPRLKIRRTALHYHILMQAYLKKVDIRKVFNIFRLMLERKIAPHIDIYRTLLDAAMASERSARKGDIPIDNPFRPQDVLDMIKDYQDQHPVVTQTPPLFSKLGDMTPMDGLFFSKPYQYRLHRHVREGSVDEVPDVYNDYVAKAEDYGLDHTRKITPIAMFTDLLSSNTLAGDDEAVEHYWSTTLKQLEELCKRSTAALTEPGWVLHTHRHLINFPLREYLKYLSGHERFDEIITVVRDAQWAGYEITNASWNKYIQLLATSPEAHHRYHAYETCEKELMHDWPGWSRLASTVEGYPRSWWLMKRTLERDDARTKIMKEKRIARYLTIVQLAGIYQAASTGAFGVADDEVSRVELGRMAPVTTEAVIEMPKLPDNWQRTFLYE